MMCQGYAKCLCKLQNGTLGNVVFTGDVMEVVHAALPLDEDNLPVCQGRVECCIAGMRCVFG
jgi:hypothetical protein